MMETPFYDEDYVNLFTLKEAAPIAQAALLDCTLVKKDTAAAKLFSLNSPRRKCHVKRLMVGSSIILFCLHPSATCRHMPLKQY